MLQDVGAAAFERVDVTKDDATEGLQRLIRKLGGMSVPSTTAGIFRIKN